MFEKTQFFYLHNLNSRASFLVTLLETNGEEMATHSSVLAWRIQGRRSLVGCRLWGRTELDTTEVTQQQQQQQILFHFLKFIYLFNFGCAGTLLLRCLVAMSRGCSPGVLPGLLIAVASLVAEHRLQGTSLQQSRYTGLVAPLHAEASQTRDQTHVPCIGRQILNHWTTRNSQQILNSTVLKKKKLYISSMK